MSRLIVTEGAKPGTFNACVEGTPDAIVTGTRQPLVDGARAMLAAGYDPAAMLTMRHAGKGFDSFEPLPIGKLATRTYTEGDKSGVRSTRWVPFADVWGTQKSGSDDRAGIEVAKS